MRYIRQRHFYVDKKDFRVQYKSLAHSIMEIASIRKGRCKLELAKKIIRAAFVLIPRLFQ